MADMIAGSENGFAQGGSVVAFNINDRSTWDWIDDGAVTESWADDNGCAINPTDRNSFYQFKDGVPYLHQCPMESNTGRLVFNPKAGVCDWPADYSDGEEIYEWAVGRGLVNDQR
jgi:hypothetical protein